MTINVYIPTPFRELTAGHGHVSASGETIADLIVDLERRYPGLEARICDGPVVHHHVNVFVNGQEMRSLRGEATRLSDGDEVAFIPALCGGQDTLVPARGSKRTVPSASFDLARRPARQSTSVHRRGTT